MVSLFFRLSGFFCLAIMLSELTLMCRALTFAAGSNVKLQGVLYKVFFTGRLRSEVQPLTLSYTILTETLPLSYIF